MIELSPSKIQTYMTCPLTYYYRYVEKIPTITNGRAWMGSAVHYGIEQTFKEKNNQAGYEAYLKKFRTQEKEINWQEEEPEAVEQEGLNLLKRYLVSSEFNNLKIIDTEININIIFRIEPENKRIVFLYPLKDSEELNSDKIICYLDAITQDGIVDWKTTKKKWTQDQIERNIQFAIYALAYHYLSGLIEIPIETHVLISKKEPELQVLKTNKTQEDFEKIKNVIYQIVKAIDNEIFYPNPNMLCENYCDYKSLCRCKV